MIRAVEAGRGKYEEMGRGVNWKPASPMVTANQEQAAAVEHILHSKDLVTAIRGVAGAGKTTMLDEAVRAIAASSRQAVLAFAPSSSATEVLKKHGFQGAATVQKLLSDPELQARACGKILLIDGQVFSASARCEDWCSLLPQITHE